MRLFTILCLPVVAGRVKRLFSCMCCCNIAKFHDV
ncbi:hypothetical protein KC19_2G080600 [Ceratodon purpureus]|uniref:Uncharacterized protein n=1 Tax=Ceratodon purpureus TaxID=3225 RepID=A0A8T0IU92_CERPU|nr:hypothetical protein KC19_2G080600 [Ceratodon purpureus]